MENKIAVVSGGAGMDARTLTHQLLAKGYTVVLTTRYNDHVSTDTIRASFANDLKDNPTAKLSFAWLDLNCPESVRSCVVNVLKQHGRIDEFYSLAALSQVGTSFENFGLTMQTNGFAQQQILETLRLESPDTRFYFACTSEIFGGSPGAKPFNESSAPDCRSPYAIAKNLGREITKYYRETYGMYACSGILFNHSNEYRKPYFFIRKVIDGAIDAHLGKRSSLELGNINFWRDEHLSDFGCEIMQAMLNNPRGPRDYVIGNGVTHSGREYLEHAYGYFGLDWQKFVKLNSPALMRPNEVVRLVADPSRAVDELNWIPNRFSLRQIIERISMYRLTEIVGIKPVKRDPFNIIRVFPTHSPFKNAA